MAAHAVAERLGVSRLADSADEAYIDGMVTVLLVSGIAALVTALLVAALLPKAPPPPDGDDMARQPADARQ